MNSTHKNKILFLTTAHHYNDDRIFYHQAKELLKRGFQVKICSLSSDFVGEIDGIEIESYLVLEKSVSEKTKIFKKIIDEFQPNCIIASEPLAIIASNKFKKEKKISLIYDITEWYPSKRMISGFNFLQKIFNWFKYFFINLYAGYLSTHFIFGEKTKEFPLANLFFLKKQLLLTYYPDEKYIHKSLKKLEPNKITLCYTGEFSKAKGLGNFFSTIDCLQKKRFDLEIYILLVGASRRKEDQDYLNQLIRKHHFKNLEIRKPVFFENFSKSFEEADICFDLREINRENHRCLPIKLFYYAASGKPVIYSNLFAIRKQVEILKFGFLVNPKESEEIANLVLKYIDSPKLYEFHAENARNYFEKKYNWGLIKESFVDFVNKSLE